MDQGLTHEPTPSLQPFHGHHDSVHPVGLVRLFEREAVSEIDDAIEFLKLRRRYFPFTKTPPESNLRLGALDRQFETLDVTQILVDAFEKERLKVQKLREALLAIYESTKLQNGIDDDDILIDSSSLGQAKAILAETEDKT